MTDREERLDSGSPKAPVVQTPPPKGDETGDETETTTLDEDLFPFSTEEWVPFKGEWGSNGKNGIYLEMDQKFWKHPSFTPVKKKKKTDVYGDYIAACLKGFDLKDAPQIDKLIETIVDLNSSSDSGGGESSSEMFQEASLKEQLNSDFYFKFIYFTENMRAFFRRVFLWIAQAIESGSETIKYKDQEVKLDGKANWFKEGPWKSNPTVLMYCTKVKSKRMRKVPALKKKVKPGQWTAVLKTMKLPPRTPEMGLDSLEQDPSNDNDFDVGDVLNLDWFDSKKLKITSNTPEPGQILISYGTGVDFVIQNTNDPLGEAVLGQASEVITAVFEKLKQAAGRVLQKADASEKQAASILKQRPSGSENATEDLRVLIEYFIFRLRNFIEGLLAGTEDRSTDEESEKDGAELLMESVFQKTPKKIKFKALDNFTFGPPSKGVTLTGLSNLLYMDFILPIAESTVIPYLNESGQLRQLNRSTYQDHLVTAGIDQMMPMYGLNFPPPFGIIPLHMRKIPIPYDYADVFVKIHSHKDQLGAVVVGKDFPMSDEGSGFDGLSLRLEFPLAYGGTEIKETDITVNLAKYGKLISNANDKFLYQGSKLTPLIRDNGPGNTPSTTGIAYNETNGQITIDGGGTKDSSSDIIQHLEVWKQFWALFVEFLEEQLKGGGAEKHHQYLASGTHLASVDDLLTSENIHIAHGLTQGILTIKKYSLAGKTKGVSDLDDGEYFDMLSQNQTVSLYPQYASREQLATNDRDAKLTVWYQTGVFSGWALNAKPAEEEDDRSRNLQPGMNAIGGNNVQSSIQIEGFLYGLYIKESPEILVHVKQAISVLKSNRINTLADYKRNPSVIQQNSNVPIAVRNIFKRLAQFA